MSGVYTDPSAVCHSPMYSNYVVDGFFVPSALRFLSSDFTSSEHTISAFPRKHSALLFRNASHFQNLYPGFVLLQRFVEICLANTVSPNGTHACVGFLPCSLSDDAFSSRPFGHLVRMHPACSTNHGKISDSSLSGPCVLLSM